jgi:hypothetical protein
MHFTSGFDIAEWNMLRSELTPQFDIELTTLPFGCIPGAVSSSEYLQFWAFNLSTTSFELLAKLK